MGIRTPDLLIANETLYQLSYTPNIMIAKQLHDNPQSKNLYCLYRTNGECSLAETAVDPVPRRSKRRNEFLKILIEFDT